MSTDLQTSVQFSSEWRGSPPLEEGGETWQTCLGRRLTPVFFVVMAPEMNLVGPNSPLGNWVDSRPLTAFGRLKRLLTEENPLVPNQHLDPEKKWFGKYLGSESVLNAPNHDGLRGCTKKN